MADELEGVLHELILGSTVLLEGQNYHGSDVLKDFAVFASVVHGQEATVVPLGFVKLAEVLVAHGLEVDHHLELLQAIVLVGFDGPLDASLGALEILHLKVGDGLPEEGVTPAGPDLLGVGEELNGHVELAGALVRAGVVVEEFWAEWELFEAVSDVVHAILGVS